MKPWSSGHTGNGLQGMCCAGLNSSVASDSLWPKGLQPARLLCSWGFSRQEHWSGLPCPPPGTSMGDECNCPTVSTSFSTSFLGTGMRIDLFQSCSHCWVFQICWHIECNTLMTSSFRVLNSSTGIPLHPLALLTAVLPKAHLTSLSRMSGSGRLTTPS